MDINGDDFPGDPERNYAVPPDNPFVGGPGLDEILAFGLRNPWRCSFDRTTGDFFIADVGQDAWEEVNFQPASSSGGENYGWNVLEGMHCFDDDPPGSCDDFLNGGSTLPILEYNHDSRCSVTGGYRYRGQTYPDLEGVYFYADFCTGRIWGAIQQVNGTWESQELLVAGFAISTFGEDETGELYLVDYNGDQSVLYRITSAQGSSPTPTPSSSPTPTPRASRLHLHLHLRRRPHLPQRLQLPSLQLQLRGLLQRPGVRPLPEFVRLRTLARVRRGCSVANVLTRKKRRAKLCAANNGGQRLPLVEG